MVFYLIFRLFLLLLFLLHIPYFTIPYNVFFRSYSAVTNKLIFDPSRLERKGKKTFTIEFFLYVQKVTYWIPRVSVYSNIIYIIFHDVRSEMGPRIPT